MQRVFKAWAGGLKNHRRRHQRRALRRTWSVELLETRNLLSVTISPIADTTMAGGKDTYVSVQGTDTASLPINYTVQSGNPSVTATVVTGGQSLTMNVSGTDSSNNPFTGNMTFRLFQSLTPNTVARIEQLVTSGFYNGLTFHRIINGFVAQGGDPNGNGTGGSGTKFNDEFSTHLTFTSEGLLAMANSGSDTNDSQFFITDTGLPFAQLPQSLNFRYTIFGILTSGNDIFQKIITTPTNTTTNRPNSPVTINSVTTFTDNNNAVIDLQAPASFTGSTTITVNATDGTTTATPQTFNLSVITDTANDPPYLGTSPATLTTTGTTPVSFTVQGIDLKNNPLTFEVNDAASWTAPNGVGTLPANVAVNITQTPASGSTPATATITLTPKAGFSGTVNLLVGVRDQTNRDTTGTLESRSNFDTQALTLTVNPQVTKANDDTANVAENSAANVIDVLANDTIATNGGTSLTISAVTQGANGTVAITGSGTGLTYSPKAGYTGSDTFTYTVKDSQGTTSTANVAITVNGQRVYRLYNSTNFDHYFTTSLASFNQALSLGYTDETTGSAGFAVFSTQVTNSTTIYELYNVLNGLHYLTLSQGEANYLVGLVPSTDSHFGKYGWQLEATGSFMYNATQTGSTEIFHIYNKTTGSHIFTENPAYRDQVIATDPTNWVQQTSLGFAFAVTAAASPNTAAAASSSAHETQAPDLAALLPAGLPPTLQTGAAGQAAGFATGSSLTTATSQSAGIGNTPATAGATTVTSLITPQTSPTTADDFFGGGTVATGTQPGAETSAETSDETTTPPDPNAPPAESQAEPQTETPAQKKSREQPEVPPGMSPLDAALMQHLGIAPA